MQQGPLHHQVLQVLQAGALRQQVPCPESHILHPVSLALAALDTQVVVGRLPWCLNAWWVIRVGMLVLQIVGDGLQLTLLSHLVEDKHQLPFTAAQLKWLRVELHWLMAAQAIEWMGQGSLWPLGLHSSPQSSSFQSMAPSCGGDW